MLVKYYIDFDFLQMHDSFLSLEKDESFSLERFLRIFLSGFHLSFHLFSCVLAQNYKEKVRIFYLDLVMFLLLIAWLFLFF